MTALIIVGCRASRPNDGSVSQLVGRLVTSYANIISPKHFGQYRTIYQSPYTEPDGSTDIDLEQMQVQGPI